MNNLKRNNWTNEEVIDLLENSKLESRGPNEFVDIHNQAIDDAISCFQDFARDHREAGALAYNIDNQQIVHIGRMLPR